MERTIVPSPISKSLPCISECAHNTEKQYDPFQIPASNLKKNPIMPDHFARPFLLTVYVSCYYFMWYVAV